MIPLEESSIKQFTSLSPTRERVSPSKTMRSLSSIETNIDKLPLFARDLLSNDHRSLIEIMWNNLVNEDAIVHEKKISSDNPEVSRPIVRSRNQQEMSTQTISTVASDDHEVEIAENISEPSLNDFGLCLSSFSEQHEHDNREQFSSSKLSRRTSSCSSASSSSASSTSSSSSSFQFSFTLGSDAHRASSLPYTTSEIDENGEESSEALEDVKVTLQRSLSSSLLSTSFSLNDEAELPATNCCASDELDEVTGHHCYDRRSSISSSTDTQEGSTHPSTAECLYDAVMAMLTSPEPQLLSVSDHDTSGHHPLQQQQPPWLWPSSTPPQPKQQDNQPVETSSDSHRVSNRYENFYPERSSRSCETTTATISPVTTTTTAATFITSEAAAAVGATENVAQTSAPMNETRGEGERGAPMADKTEDEREERDEEEEGGESYEVSGTEQCPQATVHAPQQSSAGLKNLAEKFPSTSLLQPHNNNNNNNRSNSPVKSIVKTTTPEEKFSIGVPFEENFSHCSTVQSVGTDRVCCSPSLDIFTSTAVTDHHHHLHHLDQPEQEQRYKIEKKKKKTNVGASKNSEEIRDEEDDYNEATSVSNKKKKKRTKGTGWEETKTSSSEERQQTPASVVVDLSSTGNNSLSEETTTPTNVAAKQSSFVRLGEQRQCRQSSLFELKQQQQSSNNNNTTGDSDSQVARTSCDSVVGRTTSNISPNQCCSCSNKSTLTGLESSVTQNTTTTNNNNSQTSVAELIDKFDISNIAPNPQHPSHPRTDQCYVNNILPINICSSHHRRSVTNVSVVRQSRELCSATIELSFNDITTTAATNNNNAGHLGDSVTEQCSEFHSNPLNISLDTECNVLRHLSVLQKHQLLFQLKSFNCIECSQLQATNPSVSLCSTPISEHHLETRNQRASNNSIVDINAQIFTVRIGFVGIPRFPQVCYRLTREYSRCLLESLLDIDNINCAHCDRILVSSSSSSEFLNNFSILASSTHERDCDDSVILCLCSLNICGVVEFVLSPSRIATPTGSIEPEMVVDEQFAVSASQSRFLYKPHNVGCRFYGQANNNQMNGGTNNLIEKTTTGGQQSVGGGAQGQTQKRPSSVASSCSSSADATSSDSACSSGMDDNASADSPEPEFGPGIVHRLRDKFMALSVKDSADSLPSPSPSSACSPTKLNKVVLNRCVSLEELTYKSRASANSNNNNNATNGTYHSNSQSMNLSSSVAPSNGARRTSATMLHGAKKRIAQNAAAAAVAASTIASSVTTSSATTISTVHSTAAGNNHSNNNGSCVMNAGTNVAQSTSPTAVKSQFLKNGAINSTTTAATSNNISGKNCNSNNSSMGGNSQQLYPSSIVKDIVKKCNENSQKNQSRSTTQLKQNRPSPIRKSKSVETLSLLLTRRPSVEVSSTSSVVEQQQQQHPQQQQHLEESRHSPTTTPQPPEIEKISAPSNITTPLSDADGVTVDASCDQQLGANESTEIITTDTLPQLSGADNDSAPPKSESALGHCDDEADEPLALLNTVALNNLAPIGGIQQVQQQSPELHTHEMPEADIVKKYKRIFESNNNEPVSETVLSNSQQRSKNVLPPTNGAQNESSVSLGETPESHCVISTPTVSSNVSITPTKPPVPSRQSLPPPPPQPAPSSPLPVSNKHQTVIAPTNSTTISGKPLMNGSSRVSTTGTNTTASLNGLRSPVSVPTTTTTPASAAAVPVAASTPTSSSASSVDSSSPSSMFTKPILKPIEQSHRYQQKQQQDAQSSSGAESSLLRNAVRKLKPIHSSGGGGGGGASSASGQRSTPTGAITKKHFASSGCNKTSELPAALSSLRPVNKPTSTTSPSTPSLISSSSPSTTSSPSSSSSSPSSHSLSHAPTGQHAHAPTSGGGAEPLVNASVIQKSEVAPSTIAAATTTNTASAVAVSAASTVESSVPNSSVIANNEIPSHIATTTTAASTDVSVKLSKSTPTSDSLSKSTTPSTTTSSFVSRSSFSVSKTTPTTTTSRINNVSSVAPTASSSSSSTPSVLSATKSSSLWSTQRKTKSSSESSTSIVFDFRGKDVKSNVAIRPAPFGAKPMSRRKGAGGEDDDDENYSGSNDLPTISGIKFEGEMIVPGKSSLMITKNKNLSAQFNDSALSETFEYEKDDYDSEDDDESDASEDTPKNSSTNTAGALQSKFLAASSTLSSYTPTQIKTNLDSGFELGVTQQVNNSSPIGGQDDGPESLMLDQIVPASQEKSTTFSKGSSASDLLF